LVELREWDVKGSGWVEKLDLTLSIFFSHKYFFAKAREPYGHEARLRLLKPRLQALHIFF
jgi:hypothetical protein